MYKTIVLHRDVCMLALVNIKVEAKCLSVSCRPTYPITLTDRNPEFTPHFFRSFWFMTLFNCFHSAPYVLSSRESPSVLSCAPLVMFPRALQRVLRGVCCEFPGFSPCSPPLPLVCLADPSYVLYPYVSGWRVCGGNLIKSIERSFARKGGTLFQASGIQNDRDFI